MMTAYSSPHHLKQIAILGFGRSGQAVLDKAKQLGIQAVWFDDHKIKNAPMESFADPKKWDWEHIDAVIISPGIAHSYPSPHHVVKQAQTHQIEVISEIEFALRVMDIPHWITITGTNGKSTTTALIGHILTEHNIRAVIGGNIGRAVSSLPDMDTDAVYVIEMSSYQLETTPSLISDIAVVLNITPDHLDRHGGMEGYIAAKQIAMDSVHRQGLAIIGDGDILDNLSDRQQQQSKILRIDADAELAYGVQIDNPALQGIHNAENCSAARLVCRELGLSDSQIDAAIASFTGLAHRLQPTGQYKDILFINDSKATNGEAAAKALASFSHIHWCAGGQAKSDGINACIDYLDQVECGYFYGEAGSDFAKSLKPHIAISCHETLAQAVKAASDNARQLREKKQVILLSPAAASFDQFSSFEERGDLFCQLASKQISHWKSIDKQRGEYV